MNGFMRLLAVAVLVTVLGCASRPSSDDDLLLGEGASNDPQGQQAPADNVAAADTAAVAPTDEFSEFNDEAAAPAPPVAETPAPSPVAEAPVEPTPEPLQASEAIPETPAPAPLTEAPVELTSLKFKANDSGGTIILEGNRQFAYTTRSNPDTHQFIIDIPNSILPAKLKRNLNTKDIQGAIGSIDAYQNPNSNTSRLVVQLRAGTGEPAVQQEGRSLLIVASGGLSQPSSPVSASVPAAPVPLDSTIGSNGLNKDLNDEQILTHQNLQDFMAGNMKFFGQPISIEVDNIEVTEALRFLASESGLNLVISEAVKGKVSLKLQNVPWDQALVVLLRAKKLGYVRQGSVIRIETLADLKSEEEDATKIAKARVGTETLKVKVFPLSYAKVEDLTKSLKDFVSERGKIDADPRTASILVTDIAEGIERVSKLIAALDVQPPQVMIEGKIIEASESFGRQVGVSWGLTGGNFTLGQGKNGPVDLRPSLRVAPGGSLDAKGGALGFGIHLGVLDFLGDLDANLRLNENENKVKIISSPQIVTLSNEPAKINQTSQIPYSETTLVPGAGSTVSTKFKALQMELNVTPQVTADGSVMMKVQVQRELKGALDATTGAFGVNSRTADTKILIKNGQTAVIGGIYSSDANESESRVPGLGSLPLIGSLFRYNNSTREKTELLIFLTPRILAGAQVGQPGQNFSPISQ